MNNQATVPQPLDEEQLLTIEVLRGRFTIPVAWAAIVEYGRKWRAPLEQDSCPRHVYWPTDQQTGRVQPAVKAAAYYMRGTNNSWGLEIVPFSGETSCISLLYDDCGDGHLYQVAYTHQALWDTLHELDGRIRLAETVAAYRDK